MRRPARLKSIHVGFADVLFAARYLSKRSQIQTRRRRSRCLEVRRSTRHSEKRGPYHHWK